jgi:hypothetical protein
MGCSAMRKKKPQSIYDLEDACVDGRILLKFVLKKSGVEWIQRAHDRDR